MGSYENISRLEEMKRKVDEGDLSSALTILEKIDYKKLKHITDLHLIAEVLAENGKYEEAAELYLKIFERVKSRKALFQLAELSIKLNNTEDAQYFMEEYQKVAPKDYYNYVFRYKLDKQKGESYEHLIQILEELKRVEYTEKWAYELAKLYYKAGLEQQCINECNDIILWFGDGIFVEKAKVLRSYYLADTDKDGIMKEIKRRAGILSDTETPEIQPVGDELMQDGEPASSKDMPNENPKEKEDTSTTTVGLEHLEAELNMEVERLLKNEINTVTQADLHEREEEVEQAIYHILEEDSLEAENMKLSQMKEELQIDVEEMFKDYLQVPEVKRQLVNSIEAILQGQTRMLIITGTQDVGKTTLAKQIALFLYKANKLKSSKMAKITAEKLNNLEVLSKKERLRDCCLLIEQAGGLKRKTIEGLLDLSSILLEDIAVIFEDEEQNINQLFHEYPKLMEIIQNRIHLS